MEVLARAIEQIVATAACVDVRVVAEPQALPGGFSSQLYTFRLENPPDGWTGELVLRIPPADRDACREGVIQREVVNQGYPAPAVLAMGGDAANPLGRPFLIMPKIPGSMLFVGGGPREVVTAARTVPGLLARLMADLHDLDADAVVAALDASGVPRAGSAVPAALGELDSAIDNAEAPALRSISSWLANNRPTETAQVVCHGDLHAFNVIGRYTVLDWELATIAEPAFDIARTRLLLSAVPIEMPRLARAIVQRLGRRAAMSFERGYAQRRALAEDAVSWYEALHAARILTRVRSAAATSPGPADPVAAVWAPAAPFLATRLRHITGLNVNHQ